MSAVCPSCGVAVVPGYVKCPKCHTRLPFGAPARIEGGTAVPDRRFPISAIIAPAAILVASIVVFGLLRRGDESRQAEAAPASPPTGVAAIAPPPTPLPAPTTTTATAPAGPSPVVVARELERSLQRQRLWSTVEIVGTRVDVRSSSCAEPAMGPSLDGARVALRSAGITQLRCLAQSGAVIFQRDL